MRQLLPAVPRPWRHAAKEQKTLFPPSSARDADTVVQLLHILRCPQPLAVPGQPGTQTHPRAPKPRCPGATHKTVALHLVVGLRRDFPKPRLGAQVQSSRSQLGFPRAGAWWLMALGEQSPPERLHPVTPPGTPEQGLAWAED